MADNNKLTSDNKKDIRIRNLHDGTSVMIIADNAIKIARYELDSYPDGSTELTVHIRAKQSYSETYIPKLELADMEGEEMVRISNQLSEQELSEFKKSARIQRISSTISIICVVLQIAIAAMLLTWSHCY